MRSMIACIIAVALGVFAPGISVRALEATSPPIEHYSPVFVTALQLTPLGEYGNKLDVIELYNYSSEPVDMSGWSVRAGDDYGTICIINLADYLLPDQYGALTEVGVLRGQFVREYSQCGFSDRQISTIQLMRGGLAEEVIVPHLDGAWIRKNTTKTYRSGVFEKDFESITKSDRPTIYANKWYTPLAEISLEITEVLPRAIDCSPLKTSADCSDYVKIYNPSTETVDLSSLRLRIGYKGQSITSSNTIELAGIIGPGQYGIITQKTDGSTLSIIDGGGWIWLEDRYGLTRYDSTVIRYESASSSSKEGWAWAYDVSDGIWKWTSTTTPYNQPSRFTLPLANTVPPSSAAGSLKPCSPGQYRNPETNRCRKIEATTSSLKPCGPGQFRNPLTNRCKNIETTTSSLVPCGPGEYRNPETNRCRKIASTTSTLKPCGPGELRNPETNRCKKIASTASTLKPCQPGYERNPETNRCRKVQASVLSAVDFPVEPVAETARGFAAWWALGGVLALGVGYGVWEWRSEIGRWVRRAVSRGRVD